MSIPSRHSHAKPVSSYFGENVFTLDKMKPVLPRNAFEKLSRVIQLGEKLDIDTANIVAIAMKDWALAKGCTHYTHWFQPMTGFTAEKHDSFIEYNENGKIIEKFSGKQLVQGEPDASSFPSGGIRATFEARGYTIWDPTSPAFVMEYPHGNTLCIPTIFVSYTGETLDKKAPLLRSVQALNTAALSLLKLFNNPATKVFSTLGVEQEYFLIDRSYYLSRPDLMQSGRTLFGDSPAKHQQLEDQYFGNIPERAFAFMTEVEHEAYKLGIPLKTRHNEVAPNQFEVAPIFEDVNIAVDHNQILMDLMDRVAKRHDLAVLFHEKPFAGINGSGKHCNWAIATDKGENLLNPGKTPHSNLQFLIFLVSTIKAVYEYAPILRAAIASAANDHRLGANEAPPAIISIFLGETLSKILSDIETGTTTANTDAVMFHPGINTIPEITKDNTDRNRTSPFAFTGNKFEFRAVGSSQTPSTAVTSLNTILAAQLNETKTMLENVLKNGKDFSTAVSEVVREILTQSKKILFEGDNYSESWAKEAAKRGLPNIKTTPEALQALSTPKAHTLFVEHKVYTERELEARYHIDTENYIKQIDIEAQLTIEMVNTIIIPDTISYLNNVATTVDELSSVLGKKEKSIKSLIDLAKTLSTKIGALQTENAKLEKTISTAHAKSDISKKGISFVDVKTQREKIRTIVDSLEQIVGDEYWTLPKYREMLFTL